MGPTLIIISAVEGAIPAILPEIGITQFFIACLEKINQYRQRLGRTDFSQNRQFVSFDKIIVYPKYFEALTIAKKFRKNRDGSCLTRIDSKEGHGSAVTD